MPSFRYWDDCVDPDDMKVMWHTADVSKEWLDAGEKIGQKVHISRDPDGELYLTQTEMLAIAKITIDRHFNSQLDPNMICALCEIVSDRKLFLEQYNKKLKETRIGLMQVAHETADWLASEMGYRAYEIEGNRDMLYRPFVNVYFGAAYIKWLFSCDGNTRPVRYWLQKVHFKPSDGSHQRHDSYMLSLQEILKIKKERSEEFVIRAYKGGKKKATHKSTVIYFQRYTSVKESLAYKREEEIRLPAGAVSNSTTATPGKSGEEWAFWDARVPFDDMEAMWNNPEVVKEWAKSGERRGRVHFSLDAQKRPYLSRVEVKAIAGIIIAQHFSSRGVKASALAALSELTSMRFVNGLRARTGLLGVDYPTALWLYNDLGFKAYKVNSVDDLYNPFVSMYFGAAYLAYLSEYEGRQRSYEFIVQAFLSGPENVNLQETGPQWDKFQDTLRFYEDSKREQGSCSIL